MKRETEMERLGSLMKEITVENAADKAAEVYLISDIWLQREKNKEIKNKIKNIKGYAFDCYGSWITADIFIESVNLEIEKIKNAQPFLQVVLNK